LRADFEAKVGRAVEDNADDSYFPGCLTADTEAERSVNRRTYISANDLIAVNRSRIFAIISIAHARLQSGEARTDNACSYISRKQFAVRGTTRAAVMSLIDCAKPDIVLVFGNFPLANPVAACASLDTPSFSRRSGR
jgi:hypothetical protein